MIGVAVHTETKEGLVLYREVKDPTGIIWARPIEMWDEIVDGEKRFEKIEPECVFETNEGDTIYREAAGQSHGSQCRNRIRDRDKGNASKTEAEE